MAAKDLDVVVFGATGGPAAAYARIWPSARPPPERTGRPPPGTGRLEAVLAEDGVSAPELVTADLADPASLAAMAARARVVLNLVGPYTSHGRS